MENILFILVIILALVVIVLLGVMIYFIAKFLKLRDSQQKPQILSNGFEDKMPKEVRSEVEAAKASKENMLGKFCIDHPDLEAKGRCSISDEIYCELCITKENDVRIARKFLHLFLDSEWKNTFILNNEDLGADKLNELMRVKKEIWSGHSIPIITQKQFKINIESDKIEIFTVVMSREQDEVMIEKRFGFLTANEEANL